MTMKCDRCGNTFIWYDNTMTIGTSETSEQWKGCGNAAQKVVIDHSYVPLDWYKQSDMEPIALCPSVSMWTLIPQKLMPPTRLVRYCCAVLKENTGRDRFIATGVRWAESTNRKKNRGTMEFSHRDKEKRIILMGDNDEKRQLFETCNLKGKMTVNPIVDWSDDDVWDYTHSEHLPINPLYCEGQKRVGCIGCPMAGRGGQTARVYALACLRENVHISV